MQVVYYAAVRDGWDGIFGRKPSTPPSKQRPASKANGKIDDGIYTTIYNVYCTCNAFQINVSPRRSTFNTKVKLKAT